MWLLILRAAYVKILFQSFFHNESGFPRFMILSGEAFLMFFEADLLCLHEFNFMVGQAYCGHTFSLVQGKWSQAGLTKA